MDWLDTARGFAILLVFWGHIASRSSLLKNAIYCFSAPLFIFVSGYLFRIRPGETFWAFAKRKAKSIILPCTALCVVIILFSAAWERSTAPFRLVKQLFLQIRSWPVWYMTCLYFLNLFMFLLVRMTERLDRTKTRIVVVAVNVGLVLLGWAFYHIPVFATLPWNEGITALPWNIDIAVMAFPFFCVAYYSAKNGWIDHLSEAVRDRVHLRRLCREREPDAQSRLHSHQQIRDGRKAHHRYEVRARKEPHARAPVPRGQLLLRRLRHPSPTQDGRCSQEARSARFDDQNVRRIHARPALQHAPKTRRQGPLGDVYAFLARGPEGDDR